MPPLAPVRSAAPARFAPPPRVVVITRPTELELLLARHGTRGQARFFLRERGLDLDEVEARQARHEAAVALAVQAIPVRARRARVPRAELARFVFEPSDVVVVVGQDGLVANVAKYLDGQCVVGLNPDRGMNAGILVRHDPARAEELVRLAAEGRAGLERRTMVEARLDDGQALRALNEIFVGHRTHQSARYRIETDDAAAERQSSSGVVVTTGTGATGWARSIARERAVHPPLPAPTDPWLAFFVREAFPSPATGTSITAGALDAGGTLTLRSEMSEGGVVFGDAIEDDRLVLGWGVSVKIGVAPQRLHLVA